MKARLSLVLFVLVLLSVLLLVAGSLTVPATSAQWPFYSVFLPLLQVPPATPPPPVHVLPNDFAFKTSWGSFHVLGEVENDITKPLWLVKIIVDFYDAGHNLVANDYDFVWLDMLRPGDRTCFDVLVIPAPTYASYEFEPPAYSTTTGSVPSLTLVGPTASYDSSTGDYKIIGLVRNDGAGTVKSAQVVGTLYSATGTVVGCEGTYLNNSTLAPGQSSSFTLWYTDRDQVDVASWRLQMDGSPQ